MEEKEEILIENAKEYYNYAMKAFLENNFNTATTLFFKALATLSDLHIFRKEGKLPSSHTQRFRILEDSYKEIYNMIDRNFPFYQDSYTTRITKETAEVLKEDVEKLAKELNIRFKED